MSFNAFLRFLLNFLILYENLHQTLQIPAGSLPAKYYVARPGDSLWSIAQRNSVTIDEIIDLNGLGNPNTIYPGQILRVQ